MIFTLFNRQNQHLWVSSIASLRLDLARNSFKVLRANKQLILFPVLSGISLVLVRTSFVTVLFVAPAGMAITSIQKVASSIIYTCSGFTWSTSLSLPSSIWR
jgi:hypothetical protein